MFAKIKQIMGAADPDEVVAADLKVMMTCVAELVHRAGHTLAGHPMSESEREAFYAGDRRVNALEQKVRRHIVTRVTLSSPTHRTRLLVVLGLVRDIERLGDYAKNILEAADLLLAQLEPGGGSGEDALPDELRQVREAVEAILDEAHDVLSRGDEARAWSLLDRGHQISQRCDQLVAALASSGLPSSLSVPSALAARYYKRLAKHLMNLLSSVVMPLDQVGYYDSAYRK